jgi:hypothetical protein
MTTIVCDRCGAPLPVSEIREDGTFLVYKDRHTCEERKTEGFTWMAQKQQNPVKPSVGRIVHYVLAEEDGVINTGYHPQAGEHRPAIIVRLWPCAATVQLQVFTDGRNDGLDGGNVFWATSRAQDEAEKKPGTWHWPEREEG